MGDYRYEGSADLDPERVFAYLADVRNLPRYLPQMTSAEPAGDDRVKVSAEVDGRTETGEAWMRIDRDRCRIEWGAEGPHDYWGKLEVASDGPDRCTIELDLHTTRAEGPEIEEGVKNAVWAVIEALQLKTDASG